MTVPGLSLRLSARGNHEVSGSARNEDRGVETSCLAESDQLVPLSKLPAWHSATVLPDGSNDIRKIRNLVGLNRGRLTAPLVTKTDPRRSCGDPCRFDADLLDAAMT
ncbi:MULTISPECIES: hypothetical protein [Bradyrhizobium]|uniref:hypothetical protein n=1 Tax=Bradyrhizobium TaxID=374 RepID=UPI001EDBE8E1|nr:MULTISPECIES: hypothetical protein [Bradyrhizobium]MCG2641968.1 hypothetical protein [Bradyrhizobium zhengyangense]